MTTIEITAETASKVLTVVDAGLVQGLGRPNPGEMCVEAAVCYALGLPHGDNPSCVTPALRDLKIRLNDSRWSSAQARARGLRRLAVAQLGSAGVLDEKEFSARVLGVVARKVVPTALRAAASVSKSPADLLLSAEALENYPADAPIQDARGLLIGAKKVAVAVAAAAADAADAVAVAVAAYAAAAADAAADADADAADAASRDKALASFGEEVVQVLIAMGAPGCKWLYLTDAA
jgi:hypothetical protein